MFEPAFVVATIASVAALIGAITHVALAVVRDGRTLTVPSVALVIVFGGPVMYAGGYWVYGELPGFLGYIVAVSGGIALFTVSSSGDEASVNDVEA